YFFVVSATGGVLAYGSYSDADGRIRGYSGWKFWVKAPWFSFQRTAAAFWPRLLDWGTRRLEGRQTLLSHTRDVRYEHRMAQVIKEADEAKDAHGNNRLAEDRHYQT